jgi:hypothetical protein
MNNGLYLCAWVQGICTVLLGLAVAHNRLLWAVLAILALAASLCGAAYFSFRISVIVNEAKAVKDESRADALAKVCEEVRQENKASSSAFRA